MNRYVNVDNVGRDGWMDIHSLITMVLRPYLIIDYYHVAILSPCVYSSSYPYLHVLYIILYILCVYKRLFTWKTLQYISHPHSQSTPTRIKYNTLYIVYYTYSTQTGGQHEVLYVSLCPEKTLTLCIQSMVDGRHKEATRNNKRLLFIPKGVTQPKVMMRY